MESEIVVYFIPSQPLLTMRVDERDIKKLDDENFIRLRNHYTESKQVSLPLTIINCCSLYTCVLFIQRRNTFERLFKQSDFRYVVFSGKSTALWQITPPSRTALEYLLQHETSFIPLVFSWTITR